MINLDSAVKVLKYFTYYIYNKWNLEEAHKLFGVSLGSHIYQKSFTTPNKLEWFANLDENCQKVILERAFEIYDK